MTQPEITIIGAGIGGLACSIALAQKGFAVRILEQADAITEVGAGLQITPNGVRVLAALGLGDALHEIGIPSDAVVLRDYRRGAQVIRLKLPPNDPSSSYLFVHRADLINLLANAAREARVAIELGQSVETVMDIAGKLQLQMQDGQNLLCPMVIGADGLHSKLRTFLNGAAKPFFTGQVAWRATVLGYVGADEASVFMGPGRHVVTYPLRGGTMTNIVAVEEREDWAAEGWNHAGDPDALRRAFDGFGPPVRDVLAQVENVNVWGLFRHPVATHWHGDHCALLGDAAHPTLPFLAQGANMALEDAWVLADCLSTEPSETAFATYQARRRDRVVKVIEAANGNARNYHLRNPLVRLGAHMALRGIGAVAPGSMLHRFDWVHGFDVTNR